MIAGAGVGLALSQKASLNKKVEVAEAASSASYTMTAREILAGKVTNYNDTIEIVDDVMRVTSTVAGQFNIHLQSADGTHMGKLLRNATSITFSVKISAASEFNKNVVCRYKDTSATNKWIYSTMNLNNAETGFTDVTFNAPEDLDYFEVPTFQSEVVGGYIDIRSLTFNGLTGFTNPSYTAIASGWNHGGYGGNAVLLAFNQTLGSAANTTNVAAQLADKVTINGVAIADISGGKISYDHGNNYFWVHYSADSILPTAAFPKTILEVKDGTLFQDAILNGVKLAFDTATNVWVDDDIVLHDLVANGDYNKDFKARQSTKMVGESLEQHCQNQFNSLRMTAFPNAYFEKDNKVSETNSKGDFIFRDYQDGQEFISIMFEMKNEMDTTATKHKNEDFFKELDKDRNEKGCEYAVLVSLLEADNDLYNNGIVDVSYKFPKMYVIRPQFFIPMITLLRNAALNSLQYQKELAVVRNQQLDLVNFEANMQEFKDAFGRNYRIASEKFQTAIEEIDKTIDHLEKVKKALQSSENNLRLANDKADDLTIKKLTKNAPSVKQMFDDLNSGKELEGGEE